MTPEQGRRLVAIARAAIAARLGRGAPPRTDDAAWLQRPGASFVTLRKHGRLRGCIGSIVARRALGEDVAANAVAAAFHDPRFPPLAADELDAVAIEVSVLTPPEPLPPAPNEDALLAMLRPGQDGVILEYGSRRATFLPQVWSELPDPRLFLAHLKQKAGLAADFFSPEMRVWRYAVEKFGEEER